MSENYCYSKTKILCTLGPASANSYIIESLIKAGMTGVRFNLSHGDHAAFSSLFNEIEIALKRLNTTIAILVDLQGPKIRVGELAEKEIELVQGEKIEVTIDDVLGTKEIISTSYKNLVRDAEIGNSILINDGLIRLKIVDKKEKSVDCLIEIGGILTAKKGMNLPGMKLSTPSVTEKDYENLIFLKNFPVDYIALSFVRSAVDIIDLREWLVQNDFNRPIIAKIEKKEAVDCFDEILEVADGIMVARGDLGVELLPQEVPVIQKKIIRKCNERGKLVITATQMLESMIENPIPTRAEASDVANAVWDGTDVVMLSGETSIGKYPLKTVSIMHDIVANAEVHLIRRDATNYIMPSHPEENVFDSIGRAVVQISKQVNAKVIGAFTFSGKTAINLSKYRPHSHIVAISNSPETIRRLNLVWGVCAIYLNDMDKEHLVVDKAKELMLEKDFVNTGDGVLFVSGNPYPDKSRTNWIRYEVV